MKLRILTTTGAWALGDQVLSSATNFAAAIVVARTVGPAGYGSFTLAFGTWTVLLGATRAMLAQPYTVAASGALDQDWQRATRGTAAAVVVFGVAFGIAAVGVGAIIGLGTPTGGAFVALGLFAAPLALQDFWRFAAFSRTMPKAAAINDGVWAIVQALVLSVLVLTRELTPATAVGAWGLGALAGALVGFVQYSVRPKLGAAEWRFIRQNAVSAGWFGVSNASYQAGAYGTVLLVGAGLGPTALGGLGSADNLMAPARLVASSGESIMLPLVAREARQARNHSVRRLCMSYSLGFAAFFALAGWALVWAGPFALHLLFGMDYVRFAPLLPAVVAVTAISGLASGLILGFRALGEGRPLAVLQATSAAARIAIVAATVPFGLLAVAWGLAAAETLRTGLAWVMFEKVISRQQKNRAGNTDPAETPL